VVCGLTGGSIFPSSGTCAEVSAKVLTSTGGTEGNPIPPNYGFSPGSGTANAIAADTDGDAAATAIAQLGLLRLTAQSTVGTPDPGTAALARATAAFADSGTITLPGGTAGDLVHAVVTVNIQGAHNNGVSGIFDAHLNVGSIYNVDFPNGVYRFDAHIGDIIPISLGLSIFADASYLNPFSLADYGNSAHLFIDFQEPGVYFNSVSGHDYSSTAAGLPEADLSITKTDGVTSLSPGDTSTYTIVVTNAGPSAAPITKVTDLMPAALGDAAWTCVGSGGGVCIASAVGNITDSMDLPVGATLTYTVVATIQAGATGTLTNTATVTPGPDVVDPNPANNTATDTDTVSAAPPPPPPPPQGRNSIPTLSEWGLFILASATALFGLAQLRHRNKLRP
jgi:uncharacterized repeat protein (TIGR01451 family)